MSSQGVHPIPRIIISTECFISYLYDLLGRNETLADKSMYNLNNDNNLMNQPIKSPKLLIQRIRKHVIIKLWGLV